MNEQTNPFADSGTASHRSGGRNLLWGTAAFLAIVGAGSFGWMAFRQQAQRIEQIRGELDEVRIVAARSQAEAVELQGKLASSVSSLTQLTEKLASNRLRAADLSNNLASSQARLADLEKEKELATQTHIGLEEEMRAELESKDVTISQLQGKLTVNILDRILFDSGEAVLKRPGEAVLQKIAGVLEQHPTLKIHVIGHTDNVPIRVGARSRFSSNWELSSARALAAVRFLTETAGVDPCRLGAVGYGEFRPVADNTTPEGRGKNRRIAITILADELVGADTVPTVQTNLPAIPLPVARNPDEAVHDGKGQE